MTTLSFENYQKGEIVAENIELSTEPYVLDFLERAGEDLDLNFKRVGRFENSTKKCGYNLNLNLEEGVEYGHRKHEQWIYILAVDGRVCKIGQTTKTLVDRWASYSAGTRDNRVKRGTCSTTNYFISEIVRRALEEEVDVELYAYAIPNTYTVGSIFGREEKLLDDHVGIYESRLMQEFFNIYGRLPIVGKNGLAK